MIGFILQSKPVLVGLHLGSAILGIDALLWLLGEMIGRSAHKGRILVSALLGVLGFAASWLIGGYYYIKFYGPVVKPIIKAGSAPWAHAIAMEAKEHIFLFILPLAVTILFVSLLDQQKLELAGLRKPLLILIGLTTAIALGLGLLGFIISSAARWGIITL
mgnify:CR=1 FL=1